jgi:hypothetical protein
MMPKSSLFDCEQQAIHSKFYSIDILISHRFCLSKTPAAGAHPAAEARGQHGEHKI